MTSEKSEMLIFVLKAFRRQRAVMRRTAIAVGTVLILTIWLLPPVYESNVKISLDSFSNPLGNSLLAKEISLPDLSVNDETIGSRIVELQSSRLSRKVAERTGLGAKVSFDLVGTPERRWVHKVFFPVMRDVYQVEVKRPKLTRFIKVSVRGRDDQKVKELADQYAETLIDRSVDKNLAPTRRLFRWLTDAIKDRRETDEEDIAWDPKVDGLVDTIGAVAADTEIKRLVNERLEIEQKLRAARLTYFDQHPSVLKLDRALQKLEDRIEARNRRIVSLLIRVLNGEYKITNITVLEPAELPEYPIFPRRLRLTLEVLLLAVAMGVFVGMLAQAGDRRVLSSEDLPEDLRGAALSEHAQTLDDIVQAMLSDRHLADARRVLIVETSDDSGGTRQSSLHIARRLCQLGYSSVLIDGEPDPSSGLTDGDSVVPWDDWVRGAFVEPPLGRLTRVTLSSKDVFAPWSGARVAQAISSIPSSAWVCARCSPTSETVLMSASGILGHLLLIVPQGSKGNNAILRYGSRVLERGHARTFIAILARS